jgi:hypothetical protein
MAKHKHGKKGRSGHRGASNDTNSSWNNRDFNSGLGQIQQFTRGANTTDYDGTDDTDDMNREYTHFESLRTNDELYRKIIQLRDLVMSGSHPNLKPRTTREQSMSQVRLDAGVSGSLPDGDTVIYAKVIRASIKLKRERSEQEMLRAVSEVDPTPYEYRAVADLGRILDETNVETEMEGSVFDSDFGDPNEGEGEIEDTYEPFVDDEGETREEGEIEDEFELEDEDLGYSPPSPNTPEEHRANFDHTRNNDLDQNLSRMPPPMSVANNQSWPTQTHSRTHSRRLTLESAQTPQQISLNLIQSPLAPQPAHISSLATGLGQHDFDSEELNFGVSKKRKAEEDAGLGVGYKQQESTRDVYSPGSSVTIRPEDMLVPKGYKLVKIEDETNFGAGMPNVP